jgi:hypothetical protein
MADERCESRVKGNSTLLEENKAVGWTFNGLEKGKKNRVEDAGLWLLIYMYLLTRRKKLGF